jgi:hypothetical protein
MRWAESLSHASGYAVPFGFVVAGRASSRCRRYVIKCDEADVG